MRVLMLVMSDVAGDARVLREATTLAEHGHAVHIIGKDVPDGFDLPPGVTVGSVAPVSVFGRGGSSVQGTASARPPLRPHLRLARWLLLPRHRLSTRRSFVTAARRLAQDRTFDVVHAHDFPTLELAAELAASRGARLVYDSHECWSGRARYGRPTPLERFREARAERALGARADAVITVSPGIADGFARWGWRHVVVVRNTFPARADTHADMSTPVPREAPSGLVYAGRVGGGRDLETVAAAARELARRPGSGPGASGEFRILLAGPVDGVFLSRLDMGDMELRPMLAVDDVDGLLREEGLALVTLADTCRNHRLALPNKLFHAVRARVPVVAADLPEMRRVVQGYGIGTLYRPGDPASLVAAVRAARERYAELRQAVAAAAPSLSWEHDAAVLLQTYERLDPSGTADRHTTGRAQKGATP